MKKLLLSFCAIAISTLGFSQLTVEVVSIDDPGATVDLNVPGSVVITVKNNGSTIPASTYYFSVTHDGSGIGSNWATTENLPFDGGTTKQMTLSTTHVFSGAPKTADLCISLDNTVEVGTTVPVSNTDANKQNCKSITTDYAASIATTDKQVERVYLNNDVLNVEFSQFQENLSMNIINLTGQVVATTTTSGSYTTMDVSALNAGIYILTTKSKNGEVSSKKFMIRK